MMTVTITKSDIGGSNLTLGYKDFNKDQAVRKFYVEAATTDDKDAVLTALRFHASISSLYHNELLDLPLQTISVTRIGIGTWMATAIYNRSAVGGLAQTNTLLVDQTESFEYVSIVATNVGSFGSPYYEYGLPAGPINMPASQLHNPNARHLIARRRVPVAVGRIKIPFERGVHPDILYSTFLGTINSNAVPIFGQNYSTKAYSLLFEGIECRAVATALGITYGGYYIFKYKPSGFRTQTEYFGRGSPTDRAMWAWGWEFDHIATNWLPFS